MIPKLSILIDRSKSSSCIIYSTICQPSARLAHGFSFAAAAAASCSSFICFSASNLLAESFFALSINYAIPTLAPHSPSTPSSPPS